MEDDYLDGSKYAANGSTLEEYRKELHPAIHKYLNYGWNDYSDTIPYSKYGVRYKMWELENITEDEQRTPGRKEMCAVYEGKEPETGYWIALIICRICHEIVRDDLYERERNDKVPESLTAFQVHDNDVCRALALLTEPKMVIDPMINIETGHKLGCDCNICHPGKELGDE